MKTQVFGVLGHLHSLASGRPLGEAIVQGLFAFKQHGEIAVRLGVHKNGSVMVFSCNEQLAKLVQQVLHRKPQLHVKIIESMGQKQFEQMLCSDEWTKTVLEASGLPTEPIPPKEDFEYKPQWSAASAAGYMGAYTIHLEQEQALALADELAREDGFGTEARLRSVLNEALGWKADKLDEVVEEIRGPLSDAVELYASAPSSQLAANVIEAVAALLQPSDHFDTTIMLGVNQDGSCNLFCSNLATGQLVATAINETRCHVRICKVDLVDTDAFASLVWREPTRHSLNQRDSDVEYDYSGKETLVAARWPHAAARAFIERLIDRLDVSWDEGRDVQEPPPPSSPIPAVAIIKPLSLRKKMALIEAMKEPDAVISEARFRGILHGIMHWERKRLDAATEKVLQHNSKETAHDA